MVNLFWQEEKILWANYKLWLSSIPSRGSAILIATQWHKLTGINSSSVHCLGLTVTLPFTLLEVIAKLIQDCLRLWSSKITSSPKIPNHKILGAQHLSLYEKSVSFSSCPKAKVSHPWHLWQPGVLLEHSPAIELFPESVLRAIFLLVLT